MRLYGETAVILASLVLVGCRFDADYKDTNFLCPPPASQCPEGQICVDGQCRVDQGSPDDGEEDDEGGDTVVGPPDAAPPSSDADPGCPSVSTLQEDFNDNNQAKRWELNSDSKDCDVSFADDEMTLSYELGQTISKCGMYSSGEYSLDGRTWIEVTRPGEGEPAATFGIWIGDESFLFRRVAMDVDILYRDAGGVEQILKKVPVDDKAQRFWSFVPESSKVHWEMSPDGITWENHHNAEPAAAPGAACMHYEISIFGAEDELGPPELVSFDNLNVAPEP